MECNHYNVVAIMEKSPQLSINSPRLGEFVIGKPNTKTIYKCSTCGMTQTSKFGGVKEYCPSPSDYNPTASTFNQTFGRYNASLDDRQYFSTGITNVSIGYRPNDMKTQKEILKELVNNRHASAKQLLDELRAKKDLNKNIRDKVVSKIQERSKRDFDDLYGKTSIEDAMGQIGKAVASIGSTFNNMVYDPETYQPKIMDKINKLAGIEKTENITPLNKAIQFALFLYVRGCKYEKYEKDGIKYIDFEFTPSLDQDNGKLSFFEKGKVVEWEEVGEKKFGVASKLFGVVKRVKVIRITEDNLVAAYESKMGQKVS